MAVVPYPEKIQRPGFRKKVYGRNSLSFVASVAPSCDWRSTGQIAMSKRPPANRLSQGFMAWNDFAAPVKFKEMITVGNRSMQKL